MCSLGAKTMKKKLIVLLTFLVGVACQAAFADTVDDRIQKLETELQKLKDQQIKTAAYQEQLKQMVSDTQEGEESSLAEGLKNLTDFSVDMRYRYRWTDDDVNTRSDHSNIVRGRVAMFGKVNDQMDLVLRLAGESTLSQEDSDWGASLDAIYLDYHPGSYEMIPFLGTGVKFLDDVNPFYNLDAVRGIHILFGKFEDPYYHPGNSDMGLDFDPEGVAGVGNMDVNEDLNLFGTLGGFWVDERGADADSGLWGAQLGGTYELKDISEGTYVTAGVSYYDFTHVQDRDFGGDNNPLNAGATGLASDYNLLEVFCEFGMPVLEDIPVKFFGDYFVNTQADEADDDAYLVGLGIAEHAKLGNIRFFYNYQEVGAESVLGGYSESNFGSPVTNGRGHQFTVGYNLAQLDLPNAAFQIDWYLGKRDATVNGLPESAADFQRVDASLVVQF